MIAISLKSRSAREGEHTDRVRTFRLDEITKLEEDLRDEAKDHPRWREIAALGQRVSKNEQSTEPRKCARRHAHDTIAVAEAEKAASRKPSKTNGDASVSGGTGFES